LLVFFTGINLFKNLPLSRNLAGGTNPLCKIITKERHIITSIDDPPFAGELIPSNLFDGGPTASAEWFEVGSHEGEWRSREKLHQGVDAQNEHSPQQTGAFSSLCNRKRGGHSCGTPAANTTTCLILYNRKDINKGGSRMKCDDTPDKG
jgi:hypothetical protein